MITFTYFCSDSRKCKGEVQILNDEPLEMEINANGWTFLAIVGKYRGGNYICIPNWSVGSEIAGLTDVYWNAERLINHTSLHPDDAEAIVRAIAEVNRWIASNNKKVSEK